VESAGRKKRLNRVKLAILVFLGWTAFGLFMAVPEMLVNPVWRGLLIDKIFDSWAWALLTPALILVNRRFAIRQTSGIRLVILFLLLSVPVTLMHTFLTAVFLYPFAVVWWSPFRSPDYTVFFFLGGLGVYGAVVGILQALRFYNSYLTGQLQLERVERSLVEARLNALRLHLEPHFLFNALNAISSEVGGNTELAREMIGDLGTLLRRSLDCKDRTQITLAQELSVLEHYLSIQRVRFGDRIEIIVEVEPEVLSATVPPLLLQPLVENAIRHGLEGRTSGGTICVSAARSDDRLQIRVIDDGVGLPSGWNAETATGHGVRVTRERLEALYPSEGKDGFKIRRRKRGGTEVAIQIPLQGATRDKAIASHPIV
jgi:two-component sensor histidine kinase